MLIAYVDESGDTGDPKLSGSSGCYALGCVLIEASEWPLALDIIVEFRRHVRTSFRIPLRDEIKANYLISGRGTLSGLEISPSSRNYIFRKHLEQVAAMRGRAFAIVVDKAKPKMQGRDIHALAWEMLLQRLERTSTDEKTEILLVHDIGENDRVRSYLRRARRYLTAGSLLGGPQLRFKAERFIEDPVPRDSRQSFFIQLADLVAYAAWRTYVPPGPSVGLVVSPRTFGALGDAIHADVNRRSLNGSVPGVVLRTK